MTRARHADFNKASSIVPTLRLADAADRRNGDNMRTLLGALAAFASAALASPACDAANARMATARVPTALAVTAPHVERGIEDLRFADLFHLPVGPKGLVPTDRLRALDGKRVRIVAYMVRRETPDTGGFLIAPFRVDIEDDDESLADDLPPTALFVRLAHGGDTNVPWLPGLMQFTGTLRVGAAEIVPSGRVVPAQIVLDPRPERALLRLARGTRGNRQKR